MTALVRLDRVSKSFGGDTSPALDDVTLEIPAGSCTAILGPSGSGKSTILRVLAGLDLASTGQVLVDGRDVADLSPEHRGMGMVFQRPLLFPHLSVLDNVAFADRVAGLGRAASRRNAEGYLEMVQLAGYGRRSVHELSGGQEQRVAIARSLAARPSVLLLDEPFSALDPSLRTDMHDLIRDIRAALSPTIVLVTHDRDEAAAVADRIAVLHRGELLQHDLVERIYNAPVSVRVARLLGGLNEVPGTVIDGVHHSTMGAVPLGAVDLRAAGQDASGQDVHGKPRSERRPGGVPTDGPGVLVIRQEAVGVRLAEPGDRTRRDGRDATFVGTVTGVRMVGPRRQITIGFDDGSGPPAVELHAELPAGQGVDIGSIVAVRLPGAAVAIIPSGG